MAITVYTTIAPSATQANAPLTTDLAVDWTNNIEHVREAVYDPLIHTPIIGHDHDGINSAAVNVPHVGEACCVLWEGTGIRRAVNHPPINKDIGLVFSDVTNIGGFLPFKNVTGTALLQKSWTGAITSTLDSSTRRKSPMLMHLSGSVFNTATDHFQLVLLKEVEGLLAIGVYDGTGSGFSVDISDTSDNGIADFPPDGVIVMRTDGTDNIEIRTVDHTGSNSTDFETGTVSTNAITALTSTGFTISTNSKVNNASGEYRYIAWRAGSRGSLEIEKVTSPQDGVEQDLTLTTTKEPFMALAIRTDATDTVGAQIKTMYQPGTPNGVGDQEECLRIDSGTTLLRDDSIKSMSKGLLRVGTNTPNVAGEVSNIWVFATSSFQVYTEAFDR